MAIDTKVLATCTIDMEMYIHTHVAHSQKQTYTPAHTCTIHHTMFTMYFHDTHGYVHIYFGKVLTCWFHMIQDGQPTVQFQEGTGIHVYVHVTTAEGKSIHMTALIMKVFTPLRWSKVK